MFFFTVNSYLFADYERAKLLETFKISKLGVFISLSHALNLQIERSSLYF